MSHISICCSEWTFKFYRGISHTALIRKRKEQQKHLDLFNLNSWQIRLVKVTAKHRETAT